MSKKKKEVTLLTHKGLAVISAIQSGLCPETDKGWDTDGFEKFWAKYQEDLEEYREKLPRKLRLAFDKNSN